MNSLLRKLWPLTVKIQQCTLKWNSFMKILHQYLTFPAFLLQIPLKVNQLIPDDVDTIPPVHPSLLRELNMPDVSKLQKECDDFKPILDYLCSDELPQNARAARKITAQAQSYVMTDDVLYHFYSARTRGVPRLARLIKQLAVPNSLREDIIASYHDSIAGGGHLGIDGTYTAIRF